MSVHCFKRPCRCWFWKPGLRSPACGEPAVTERPQTARKGRGGRAGRLGSTLPFLSANPGLQLQCREPWPRLGLGPGRTTVLLSTRPSVAVARTQGPRHCQMLPQSLGYEKQLKEGLLVVSVGGGRRCLVPPGEPEPGAAVLPRTLGFCVSSGHVWLPLCECPRTPNLKILVKTDLFFSLRLYLGS